METRTPPRITKHKTVTLKATDPGYVLGTSGAKIAEFQIKAAGTLKIERTLELDPTTASWQTLKSALVPAVGDIYTFPVGAAQFFRITCTVGSASVAVGTSVDYVHAPLALTPFKNIDVDESEDDVKTTACTLHVLHAINKTASIIYLKLYNATAASVSVGTTVPTQTYPVPANADSDGAGFILPIPPEGIAFDTALCIAATTGVADNDTGAPGANDLVVNGAYR